MKHITLALTSLVIAASRSVAAEAKSAEPAPIRVFLIDDQTGEELLQKHGIHPIETDDMIELINMAIIGHTPVQLFHHAVDEDASDNTVAQLVFKPFSAGPRPTMPEGPIPVYQFPAIKKAYEKQRSQWQREILAYQREVVGSTQAFIQRVANTQVEVAQRFDRMLEARNGRDFNRSDIVGSLVAANQVLGQSGRRILVLNTDAADMPGNRKARRTPLTSKELDPGIELLFVNTSRIPEQSILFAGVGNPIHHSGSMKEAMRYIAEILKKTEVTPESAGAGDYNSALLQQR